MYGSQQLARTDHSSLPQMCVLVQRTSVPFVAHEGAREPGGVHTCDKRSRLSDLKREFPMIDYSEVDSAVRGKADQSPSSLMLGTFVQLLLIFFRHREMKIRFGTRQNAKPRQLSAIARMTSFCGCAHAQRSEPSAPAFASCDFQMESSLV